MKDQLQIPTKQKPNKCMLQLQFQISSPGRMLSSKVNLLPWNMQLGSIHAVLKHMWAYLFYILVNFTSDELSGTNNMCVGMVNGYIEAKCLQHNELKIILATWLYKLHGEITLNWLPHVRRAAQLSSCIHLNWYLALEFFGPYWWSCLVLLSHAFHTDDSMIIGIDDLWLIIYES